MAMAIGGAALSADAETPRWDLAGSEAQAVETLDPDGRVSFDPEMVSLARRFGVRVELAAVIYEESRQAGWSRRWSSV